MVIENGFDTMLFRPDAEARAQVRSEFHLQESHLLIGLAGRLDPVKGHEMFLRAAKTLFRTESAGTIHLYRRSRASCACSEAACIDAGA
jgi:glycosyltransferase involved in cell wall biosynthesis